MRTVASGAMVWGLGFGALAVPGLAQPTPVGVEFQVNTHTLNVQAQPAAAIDSDGDFVVVWTSIGADESGSGILAQRFASSGAPLAAEFQVNAYTPENQASPAVAMDADGDFVVIWESAAQLSSFRSLLGRRFDASGAAQAIEFQVSVYTLPTIQQFASVAMENDGAFVVAWWSLDNFSDRNGVFARRFDASGMPLGVEFQVDDYTLAGGDPTVAIDDAGNFVVAYDSPYHDGSLDGIFARRFDSLGNALASEFQVNTYTPLVQFLPFAAMDDDGDFVVAWTSTDHATGGYPFDVFARRFDASGNAKGAEFQVNTSTFPLEMNPTVALDEAGGFVVVWDARSGEDFTTGEVFARQFDAAGLPQGSQFRVNTYSTGPQRYPTIVMKDEGDFVVAWASRTGGVFQGQDGDGDGVFAQRFAADTAATLMSIDIRPSVFPNIINLHSNGKVKVAILTTSVADGDGADFDAFDVDPFTVTFGPAGAPVLKEQAEDVDFDGDIDLVLSFRTGATGIPCGATQTTLIGETFASMTVEGSDSVVTQGC